MNKGKLILLNGSSSCGKTSTGRVLQDMFDEQFILLGMDAYLQAMPPKQNNITTIEAQYFSAKKYIKNGLDYYDVKVGPMFDSILMTSYQSITVFLEAGINVISDQLFWSPKWFRAALDVFIPYPVFFVGMFVEDAEGARREIERSAAKGAEDLAANGRPGGMNRTSALITHQNMIYDFTINNTELSIEETAQKIKEAFIKTSAPLAFKTLYHTFKGIE